MSELWLTCGIPGSGKSTWAKTQADEEYIWVSRDEIRNELLNLDNAKNAREKYFTKETLVYNTYIEAIVYNLNQGKTVIADATHISRGSRMKLLNRVKSHPALKEEPITSLLIFPTYYEKCIERNEQRVGWRRVPNGAIEAMYKEFLRDLKDVQYEGFNSIMVYDEKTDSFECKYYQEEV